MNMDIGCGDCCHSLRRGGLGGMLLSHNSVLPRAMTENHAETCALLVP